jgi:hypothetical protein
MINAHTTEYYNYDDIENFVLEQVNLENEFWDIWSDCVYEDVSNGKMSRGWFMMILDRLKGDFLRTKYSTDCDKLIPVFEELKKEMDPNDLGCWILYSW